MAPKQVYLRAAEAETIQLSLGSLYITPILAEIEMIKIT
jgi:hypothetical protein